MFGRDKEAVDLMVNFMQSAHQCRSRSYFEKLLKDLTTHLGLDGVTWWYGTYEYYEEIDMRNPEWMKVYTEQDMLLNDPIFLESAVKQKPFVWRDILNKQTLTKAAHKVMSLAEDFGLREGLLFPVQGPNKQNGCLSFFTTNDKLAREVWDKFSPSLLHIAVECQRLSDRIGFATDLHSPPVAHGLSEVELSTLTQMAHGKKRHEVAKLLKVSPDTVKSRMDSIRYKLGAQNATEACMIAYRNGLIVY